MIGGEEGIAVVLIKEVMVVTVVKVVLVGVVDKVEFEGLELPVELPKVAEEGLDVVDQKYTMTSVEAAINNNGTQIRTPVISDSGCIPRRDFMPGLLFVSLRSKPRNFKGVGYNVAGGFMGSERLLAGILL